jgi:hypothetical protein
MDLWIYGFMDSNAVGPLQLKWQSQEGNVEWKRHSYHSSLLFGGCGSISRESGVRRKEHVLFLPQELPYILTIIIKTYNISSDILT